MEIDPKYKIGLVGKYNRSVCTRNNCDEVLMCDEKHGSMFEHILGFSDTNMGVMMIIECPECFTKWCCHADKGIDENGSGGSYSYFLDYLGSNKHYNGETTI